VHPKWLDPADLLLLLPVRSLLCALRLVPLALLMQMVPLPLRQSLLMVFPLALLLLLLALPLLPDPLQAQLPATA
jgi:hypothetical protein